MPESTLIHAQSVKEISTFPKQNPHNPRIACKFPIIQNYAYVPLSNQLQITVITIQPRKLQESEIMVSSGLLVL